MESREKKRILVLGGGFAGVECTLKLESYFKNNSNIEITLVSEDNFYFLHQCFHKLLLEQLKHDIL